MPFVKKKFFEDYYYGNREQLVKYSNYIYHVTRYGIQNVIQCPLCKRVTCKQRYHSHLRSKKCIQLRTKPNPNSTGYVRLTFS